MDHLELELHESADPASAEADQIEDGDLKWLMAAPQGRRIVRRFFEESGVWRLSFTGEPLGTAFREGQRNVGNRLLAKLLRAAPEATARIVTGQDGK